MSEKITSREAIASKKQAIKLEFDTEDPIHVVVGGVGIDVGVAP